MTEREAVAPGGPAIAGELLVETRAAGYGYAHASAFVDVVYPLEVRVARIPRRRCAHCKQRRVLYRIRVATAAMRDRVAHGETEARCAPCWGITPEGES